MEQNQPPALIPWDERLIHLADCLSTKPVDKVEDKFADYFPETRQARLSTIWRFFEQIKIVLFFNGLKNNRPIQGERKIPLGASPVSSHFLCTSMVQEKLPIVLELQFQK